MLLLMGLLLGKIKADCFSLSLSHKSVSAFLANLISFFYLNRSLSRLDLFFLSLFQKNKNRKLKLKSKKKMKMEERRWR